MPISQQLVLANTAAVAVVAGFFVGWAKRRISTGTIVEGKRRFPVPHVDRFAANR